MTSHLYFDEKYKLEPSVLAPVIPAEQFLYYCWFLFKNYYGRELFVGRCRVKQSTKPPFITTIIVAGYVENAAAATAPVID